jgi:hypothetical protein
MLRFFVELSCSSCSSCVMPSKFRGEKRTAFRTSKVVTYRVAADNPRDDLSALQLACPGTVGVLVAPKGDPVFKQLRAAMKGGDVERHRFAERLFGEFREGKRLPLEAAKVAYAEAASVGKITYKRQTVLSHVVLGDGKAVSYILLLFSGTPFKANSFALEEEYDPNVDGAELRVAMIFCDPPALSESEQRALAQVDPTRIDLAIGPPARAGENEEHWQEAALCMMAMLVIALILAAGAEPSVDIVHLSDEEVKKLGAAETAAELMRRRIALLAANSPK